MVNYKSSLACLARNPLKLSHDHLFKTITDTTPWVSVVRNSRTSKIKSCWFTKSPCTCNYEHSGNVWEPNDFPPWLTSLTSDVEDLFPDIINCKAGARPCFDSCNVSFYQNGTVALGPHSDDEPLFLNRNGFLIVSLSLGEARTFVLESMDKRCDVPA